MYLPPLEVEDLVEPIELLQAEILDSLVIIIAGGDTGITVQGLEYTHDLPLGCVWAGYTKFTADIISL